LTTRARESERKGKGDKFMIPARGDEKKKHRGRRNKNVETEIGWKGSKGRGQFHGARKRCVVGEKPGSPVSSQGVRGKRKRWVAQKEKILLWMEPSKDPAEGEKKIRRSNGT